MLLLIFIFGALVELCITLNDTTWNLKNWLLPVVVVSLGAFLGAFVMEFGPVLAILALTVGAYRLFCLLRLAKNRVNGEYLRFAVRRSSVVFIVLLGAVYYLAYAELTLDTTKWLVAIAAAQLAAATLVLGFTARNLYKTKSRTAADHLTDQELPSVTVALPARNETADLASCLESVLANDYPKLEVLVLDDCSQDRTSEIIRDFAHDGVRFVEGRPISDRWLAKNQAYQQLLEEASGKYVLFMGVDVRLGPHAIRALVTTLLSKKREMLSIMPFRIGGGVRTAFIQPMRYWWELALPRRLFNRPAVLSTCWIINRSSIKKLGAFSAVSHTIIPEGYFARELIKSDKYAFLRASEDLNIRTVKSVEDQLSTAVRTRYPQVKKRPENIFALALLEVVFLLAPCIRAISGFFVGFATTQWLAVGAAALLVLTHYLVLASSNPANSTVALFNFPLVILTELVLIHLSMQRYEFGTVDWRGRNICIPVMRTVPNKNFLANLQTK
jgi:chlorobactene glucosyltransferase